MLFSLKYSVWNYLKIAFLYWIAPLYSINLHPSRFNLWNSRVTVWANDALSHISPWHPRWFSWTRGRRQVVLKLSVLGTAHRYHQAAWWLHSPSEACLLKDCCSQYCTRAQIRCDNLDINPTKTDGYWVSHWYLNFTKIYADQVGLVCVVHSTIMKQTSPGSTSGLPCTASQFSWFKSYNLHRP